MSYRHAEQWRMAVLFSGVWEEDLPIKKKTDQGETLSYFVHHLDHEGLIEVTSTLTDSEKMKTYRFDRYGRLKGIFESHANGIEQALYERYSEFGDRRKSEIEATKLVDRLRPLVSL